MLSRPGKGSPASPVECAQRRAVAVRPTTGVRPVLDNIQLARERAKPYLLERCRQPRPRETCSITLWVDQSAGERAERQIGSLRLEEDPPFAEPDFAAAERPKSGQFITYAVNWSRSSDMAGRGCRSCPPSCNWIIRASASQAARYLRVSQRRQRICSICFR